MERRNSPRLVVNHPVWIIGLDRKSESDEQRLGYAIDVSESGMLLEIQGEIVENRIKVFASTINNRVIEIAGRIVAIDGSGSGYSKIHLKFEGNLREGRSFYDDFMQAVRLKQRRVAHSTQEDRA